MTDLLDRQSRSRRRTAAFAVVVALTAVVALVAVVTLAAGVTVRSRYDSRIERFDVPVAQAGPDAVQAQAAPAADGAARTFLVMGSDSRVSAGDPSQWQVGAQRTDAILLVHVPADRSGVYVVSIPRDTWVDVPGHGRAKINAAFSYGGPALLVQTVEQLTGLDVEHTAVVDFEGLVAMTDALGGVTITVPEQTEDSRATFPAGTRTMDGETALDYVRQRHGLDDGDLDRVRRQQNWIRSVMQAALSRDTLSDPRQLDAFLLATTSSVALDSGFGVAQLRDLAVQLRGIRSDDVTFLTVPLAGFGRSPDGTQSIVLLDEPAADGLWQSVQDGTLPQWVAGPDADLLGETVD